MHFFSESESGLTVNLNLDSDNRIPPSSACSDGEYLGTSCTHFYGPDAPPFCPTSSVKALK